MSALGIDFGTSTTIMAVYQDRRMSIIKAPSNDEVTPSYVAFMPDNKKVFGRAARSRRLIDPDNTLFSFKRILGKSWVSSEVRAFGKQYPFFLEKGDDNLPRFVTRAGKLGAGEVTTLLLSYLHQSTDLAVKDMLRVTMTVPTAFRSEQRQALIAAGMHAGFRNVDVIEEPCAAAAASLRGDPRDQVIVVYDLGGGTFDVTVVQQTASQVKVLATGGDSYLGGDDITARCANWVAEQVLEQFHWNIRSSDTSYQKLVFTCDNIKHYLSFSDQHEINLTGIDEILKEKSIFLTREHVERISMDLVQRTFLICDETLRKAGILASRVDAVVLSGGCCYMPLIRNSVKNYFGQEPKMQLPPDKVVALGAALHAGEQTLMTTRPSP